jgi:hypothetical protein
MSYQGPSWYHHTVAYLKGVDPNLAEVFTQAMERAGFPEVNAAEALEAICADFLAGPSLRSVVPIQAETWPPPGRMEHE